MGTNKDVINLLYSNYFNFLQITIVKFKGSFIKKAKFIGKAFILLPFKLHGF